MYIYDDAPVCDSCGITLTAEGKKVEGPFPEMESDFETDNCVSCGAYLPEAHWNGVTV